MLRPSEIAKFLLVFTILYAAFVALWPTVGPAYGDFYRSSVQTIVGLADREERVVIRASSASAIVMRGSALDTQIVCRMPGKDNKGRAREMVSDRSSRYSGYAPLTLTLTLILATPLPWRRRAAAAFWGALLATWFAILVPQFQIYPLYLHEDSLSLFTSFPSLYSAWHTFAFALSKMTRWATLYYMVPFMIWIIVSFRMNEVAEIVERLAAKVGEGAKDSDT